MDLFFIPIESGKRGGQPCIRGMWISVYNILGWLASRMSSANTIDEYPERTVEDIRSTIGLCC